MPTLGVFLIPPRDHPLYELGSALLGYDIWRRRHTTPLLAGVLGEERLRAWLGPAPTYGFHCTIVAGNLGYEAADVPEVRARLAWAAGRLAPFTLVNGRMFDDFHAGHHALVTTFDSPDGALGRLHRQLATLIAPLHSTSGYASRAARLDEAERRNFYRVGEPWALELFSPHWTLASGLPDRAAWEVLREAVLRHTDLFADGRTRSLHVADVHLVERGQDGYYTVAASYPLGG